MGSTLCRPVAACGGDRKVFWGVAVPAILGAAAIQLAVVSGVWRGSHSVPSGVVKLLIYVFQVGDCGVVPNSLPAALRVFAGAVCSCATSSRRHRVCKALG